VWRALLLNANLSVLDAHYTSFRDPDDARARERRPIATPPYSLTVAATWLEDLGSAGELSLRTEWTHESATATDVLDTRRLRQSKHGELAATLTWSLADGRTQLVVFGRNLLDRTYVSDSLGFRDSFGHGIRYFSEPRSYGLEIRRSF
jgi:iron complex outermembrane receptor protein